MDQTNNLAEIKRLKLLLSCFWTGEVHNEVKSIDASILASWGAKRLAEKKKQSAILRDFEEADKANNPDSSE